MLCRVESLRPSSGSWGRQGAPNSIRRADWAARKLVMSRALNTKCFGPVHAVPNLLANLDDPPSLTRNEVATSVLNAVAVSSIVSALMPFVTWTDQTSWTNQILAATMSFLMVMAVYMNSFIEAQYSGHCSPVTALADQDSHFVSIEGTHVHAKRQTANGKLHRTMHCFHGFGAALNSWDSVQGSLAAQCCAVVTAHDMPGFGLSERSSNVQFYSQQQNAQIGLEVMDHFRQKFRTTHGCKQVGRRILVGHSMGGASAVAAALLRPQEVAALVLIAPTVMASSGVVPLEVCELGVVGTAPLINFNIAVQPHQSSRQRSKESMPSSWQNRRQACRRLLRVLASCFLRASHPFVILPLRCMVRSKHFWQRGLEVSRFDTSKVTPALIDIYRRPMLVKGWEQGLVNFAAARIAGDIPLRLVLQDIWTGRNRQTSAELLKKAVKDHNIKVLIIHGADDNVIPVSNSVRLAQMIPGARLKVLDCIGHIPQEESPDEIIDIITKFLSESQV